MADKKTSFVLPTDCIEDLEDFTDAEAGELFKAILIYANEQKETEFSDRAMKMYFKRIKKYIDSANENYEKVIQANRLNGAKGGRPKKETEENPKKPILSLILILILSLILKRVPEKARPHQRKNTVKMAMLC